MLPDLRRRDTSGEESGTDAPVGGQGASAAGATDAQSTAARHDPSDDDSDAAVDRPTDAHPHQTPAQPTDAPPDAATQADAAAQADESRHGDPTPTDADPPADRDGPAQPSATPADTGGDGPPAADGTGESPPGDPIGVQHADDGPLTEAEFYDVVGNERRRACVNCLLEGDGETPVSELVAFVVDQEDGSRDDASHRKSVYASLRQTHLPKLAEYGVVDYDSDANTVAPEPTVEAFETSTDTETTIPRTVPWPFVGLGVLALGWFAAGLLDVVPLDHERFLLVSMVYVLLVLVEGLWEVQQLRSALHQVRDGR